MNFQPFRQQYPKLLEHNCPTAAAAAAPAAAAVSPKSPQCYGVGLCYGVSPCYGARPCYGLEVGPQRGDAPRLIVKNC